MIILGDKETIMRIWEIIEKSIDKVKMFKGIKKRAILEVPIDYCNSC